MNERDVVVGLMIDYTNKSKIKLNGWHAVLTLI